MDWTSLGHAGWLVEAGGLRLLFDPLLGESHHDGVFGVTPPRRIDVDRLRPDVIVVSHRHPDHFDLPSLHALARRSPDAVVLTADVLVGRACQRLGFRHVSVLPDRHDVALDGLSLRTTPSRCSVVEWGMLVSTADGTAWNQVDTVLGSPEQIREELALAATAMGAPSLADGPDLGIVRWQPLLQVTAAIGGSAAFPFAAWQRELERIVATAPRPAASTTRPGTGSTRGPGPCPSSGLRATSPASRPTGRPTPSNPAPRGGSGAVKSPVTPMVGVISSRSSGHRSTAPSGP
jgi:UDP-MurNAc hydroxylase